MFRVFGVLCVMTMGHIDCTTHYRTDMNVFDSREKCEAVTQHIMEDTLKQFKELGIVYESFEVGCEKITTEEYKQWKIDKMNSTDDEI